MKFVFIFLALVTIFVNEVNEVHAHAEMFLAGTNDFIGTINFNEQEVAWGVVISGSVNRLRSTKSLVSFI